MNAIPNEQNLNWSNSASLNGDSAQSPLYTNKLVVYLIKEAYSKEYLSQNAEKHKDFDDGKTIIFKRKSFGKPPKFISQFFHENIDNVFSSSAQVLLVLEDVGEEKRTLAFAFGVGRCLLNRDSIEQRFGLKTALNLIDPNGVKKFSKTKLDSNPKNEKSQLSKKAGVSEFGIDITQDLIKGVSGAIRKSYVTTFGRNVSGTDSLNLRIRCDITTIRQAAEDILKAYKEKTYRESFEWIDQIQEVKDKRLINSLNDQLIDGLCANSGSSTKIWASVPDFIDDDNLDGYRIGNNTGIILDDINKQQIIEKLNGKVDLKHLKNLRIYAVSAADDSVFLDSWSAYKCLYAEITNSDNVHLLLDGGWYAVNKNFAKEIQDSYQKINYCDLGYPDYDHGCEADYNHDLANVIGGICCDAQPIQLSGRDKVELCDVLLNKQQYFIHIKRYSGSSVLSHLFNQGLVSGELLKDSVFKKKAENKFNIKLGDLAEATIVFGIVTNSPEKFDMPFFSKVSLLNVIRRLTSLGYEIKITKIRNIKQDKR